MFSKIVLEWIVFNVICALGAVLLVATGRLSSVSEALPTLIGLAMLSLPSIILHRFMVTKKNRHHEKP